MKSICFLTLFACALTAGDFEFCPVRVAPTSSDKEPCALQFTWDRPDQPIIAFQAFLLFEEWPADIDKRVPDWRKRLEASHFDNEEWAGVGGPRMERHRQVANIDRRPLGFIDRRDTWYAWVCVLVADKDMNWCGVSNPRWSAVAPHSTRSDLYYLSSYQPWMPPMPMIKAERVKLQWTMPDLPKDFDVTRLIFVACKDRYWGEMASSGRGGIEGWLSGLRDDAMPRVLELSPDAREGGFKPGLFDFCWVLVDTKVGLKFLCPFKREAGKNELGEKVEDDEEYRKLLKLNPELVKYRGLPKRAELARKSENWPRIEAALNWLKDHQNLDGHWSASEFSAASTRRGARYSYNAEFVEVGMSQGDAGLKGSSANIGVTGLALVAFTAAGITGVDAVFGTAVRRASAYLRKVQQNDGAFVSEKDDWALYAHAEATIAMSELMALGGNLALKPCVNAAAQFILKAQNPNAGWRYGVRPGVSDTSLTTAMVIALQSCSIAGINLELSASYLGAAGWYKAVTVSVSGNPKTGYDTPGSNNARLRNSADYANNPALDAMHICGQLVISQPEWDKNNRVLMQQAKYILETSFAPTWDHKRIDYYYWNFGSLALYLMGDRYWLPWRKAVMKTLLENQRGWRKGENNETAKTLDEHGSWDAVDAWHAAGGRVYSTAINCLTLQTEWRYTRP